MQNIFSRRAVLFALFLVATPVAGFAQALKMSAPEALAAVQNGDIVLLDIRSPGEWKETGLAQGAWPVTMHDPSFGENLQRILSRYPDTPLALICATGGRTEYVASVLRQNGLSNVIDVSEGMFGNGAAPGWIARKMPIIDEKTARANYTAGILAKQ
ncbi:MAG: rhodanese-like domain-containing protein [Planktotalea sp.]